MEIINGQLDELRNANNEIFNYLVENGGGKNNVIQNILEELDPFLLNKVLILIKNKLT